MYLYTHCIHVCTTARSIKKFLAMEPIDQSETFCDQNLGEGWGKIYQGSPWLQNAKQSKITKGLPLFLFAKSFKNWLFYARALEKLGQFFAFIRNARKFLKISTIPQPHTVKKFTHPQLGRTCAQVLPRDAPGPAHNLTKIYRDREISYLSVRPLTTYK